MHDVRRLGLQVFAAPDNMTGQDQIMVRAREVDFVTSFARDMQALLDILGITRMIKKENGSELKVQKASGTLQSGEVAEGEEIPMSQYEVTEETVGKIKIDKYRKGVSLEAIASKGYAAAVDQTDQEFRADLRNVVTGKLYDTLKSGSLVSFVAGVVVSIVSAITPIAGTVASVFNTIFSTVSGIMNRVGSVISSVFSSIRSAWSGLTGFVSGVFSGIAGAVQTLVGQVKGFVNGVISGINAAISVINMIPGVSIGSIPYLAHGTDNWQGGFAVMNEGGRGELTYLPNGAQVIPHDISVKYAKEAARNNATVEPLDATALGQYIVAAVGEQGAQIADGVERGISGMKFTARDKEVMRYMESLGFVRG